jgi:hypothetical protein
MPHGRQEFIAVAPASAARMTDLAQALLYEANVIEELRQALLRQRAGVSADDAEQVEASIHAMGRTLLTLEEARRRRGALTALISGAENTPLERLEAMFGGILPAELESARARVKRAALATAQDVAINQHILRRALEAGDAFLQRLFSMGADPAPSYQRSDSAPDAAPRAGLILNRTA